MRNAVRTRLAAGALIAVALAGLYWWLDRSGALATIMDANALHARVEQLGAWGPVAIVVLMILAILVAPIPSAPIALAAGAAYGHGWGTLYVLLGAEAGALAAFSLARFVGHKVVHHWFGDRLSIGLVGSQNALTGLVFASRLLPFISFDIVSYAAGLTVLKFWRFAIATLVGIAPTSFLLAHIGRELGSGDSHRLAFAVVALGGVTLVPVIIKLVRDRRTRQQDKRDSP